MRRHAKQNVLLTIWLVLPWIIIGLLIYWIFVSFQKGPAMHEPGVGAGAGDTGGANAIGEMLHHEKSDDEKSDDAKSDEEQGNTDAAPDEQSDD
ncbi:MAG: hypothetical protein R3B57_02230 [Phycisphaerales bacterium]